MAEALNGEEVENLSVALRQLSDETGEGFGIHAFGIGLFFGYVGWVGKELLGGAQAFFAQKEERLVYHDSCHPGFQ